MNSFVSLLLLLLILVAFGRIQLPLFLWRFKPKVLHVLRPLKLLEISRVFKLFCNPEERVLHIVHSLLPLILHLCMNLLFVIKYRIPEYTLHILMCYLRGPLPWTPQMLPTINCQHYTCITEFLRLIIRQQQHPLITFFIFGNLFRSFRLKCISFTPPVDLHFFLFLTSLQIHFIILVTEKVYTFRVIYRDFPWE